MRDWNIYKKINWEIYSKDRRKRREIERWIENIINSSIDISKLILEMENITIPETYREIVFSVSLVREFGKKNTEKISRWVKLRNILAHEYLDIKWNSIKKFLGEGENIYRDFVKRVKKYIKKKFK